MTPSAALAVHGDGRMGQALARRLRRFGVQVTVHGPDGPDDRPGRNGQAELSGGPAGCAIVCVPSGVESRTVVDRLCRARPTVGVVVDLTTQDAASARASQRQCGRAGVAYAAGGILGGRDQVSSGDAALVLGPPVAAVPAALKAAWPRIHWRASAAEAVRCKLVHNYVSVQSQIAVAEALAAMGPVAALDIATVLELGPAGRRPRDLSIVRDWHGEARSSYAAGLLRKDLDLIGAEFPALGAACRAAAARLRGPDDRPFTVALREGVRRHAPEPT